MKTTLLRFALFFFAGICLISIIGATFMLLEERPDKDIVWALITTVVSGGLGYLAWEKLK